MGEGERANKSAGSKAQFRIPIRRSYSDALLDIFDYYILLFGYILVYLTHVVWLSICMY